MDWLEFFYDYFEDRGRAAALIRQRRPYAAGLFGAWLGGASLFVADALAGRHAVLSFSWPSLAIALLWQTAFLFAAAAVLHLLLDMTGARGDAGALFVHLGLADLAWLAALPAVLALKALAPASAWSMRAAFFLVGLWSLALKARGVRDEYGVGEARAWLTLGLPYFAVAGLVALTGALALVSLVLKALS